VVSSKNVFTMRSYSAGISVAADGFLREAHFELFVIEKVRKTSSGRGHRTVR